MWQSLFLHQKVIRQQKVLSRSLSINNKLLSFGSLYQTVVKFPAYPFIESILQLLPGVGVFREKGYLLDHFALILKLFEVKIFLCRPIVVYLGLCCTINSFLVKISHGQIQLSILSEFNVSRHVSRCGWGQKLVLKARSFSERG